MADNTRVCRHCIRPLPEECFSWTDKRHKFRRKLCRECRGGNLYVKFPKTSPEDLKPIVHPNMLDIAWAAGIWEGEGSCSLVSQKWFRMSVCQKDPHILHKLRDMFGGSLHTVKHENGTNVSKKPSEITSWYLYGPRAYGFAQTIFSFLSPRRRNQIKRSLGISYGQ